MKILKAESVNYEIEKSLGEGLTSEVYKAFRVDSQKQTRQAVALKILKSKNHVHIFRQEFERLMKVSSPFCVKLLGWENLNAGPALVLEYLEGVTLYELICREKLSDEIVDEVVAQVQLGLRDLHQSLLIHGDLNCKNIFVTKQGVVKLLDFGWSSKLGETMATPQFMAPELWQGLEKSEATDQYSLGLIYSDLIHKRIFVEKDNEGWEERASQQIGNNSLLEKEPESRQWLKKKSHIRRRVKLSQLVNKNLRQNTTKTHILKLKEPAIKKIWKKVWMAAALLILSFYPQLEAGDATSYSLTVRSDQWLEVSVNSLPGQFSPFNFKGLRPGKYQLAWKTKDGEGIKKIQVDKDSLFLLQLEDILLR